MARRNDFITLTTRGAGDEDQLAKDFTRAQRRIQDRVNRTMRLIDAETMPVYRTVAPSDTGELMRGLESRISFRAQRVRITVSVAAERDGFDYVAVTRFGHRVRWITPKRKLAMTVHTQGRYSMPILRHRVPGYRPRRDWVVDGTRRVIQMVDRHSRELGRDIDTVLLRSARGA